jgi:hypothetical protein
MPILKFSQRRKTFARRFNSIIRSPFFKIVLVVVISIAAILVFGVLKSDIFKIKDIEIEAVNITCTTADQILNVSEIKDKNFFMLNGEESQVKIKRKFYCIKDVVINLYPFQKAKIKVSNRVSIANLSKIEEFKEITTPKIETLIMEGSSSAIAVLTVATPSANLDFSKIKVQSNLLIDDEGVVFLQGSDDNLPIIYTNQIMNLGQSLDKNSIKHILKIWEKVKEFGLSFKDTKLSASQYIINSEPKLIFDLSRDINIQLASLQLILEEAKINDSRIEYIDLRFDKPVVKYLPKKGEK